MLRFVLLISTIFVVAHSVPIDDETKSLNPNVIVIDNIKEYIAKHPELKVLGKLEKKVLETRGRFQIHYSAGNRVNGK